MLALTGASGKLGGLTLRHLLQRVDSDRVLALSRTPANVTGARTRVADFTDPAGLPHAFEGVERLLIISLDALSGRVPFHANAIDAAAKAGVGHLIYTSVAKADDPANPDPHGVVSDHRETERLLADSGVPFTVLRYNIWPEVLDMIGLLDVFRAGGELWSNAGDGRVGYVTRDDSAAVAAALLASGGHLGETLEVTGPEGVTDADLAAALGVRHVPVDDAGLTARLVAAGMQEPHAQAWTDAGRIRGDGWYDVRTDAVERITGRRPTSVAEYFSRQNAAHGPR